MESELNNDISKKENRILDKIKHHYKKNKKHKNKTKQLIVQYQKLYHICIEIFNDNNLMTEKELKSLSYQILRIYSLNKGTNFPVNLYISNFSNLEPYLEENFKKWNIKFFQSKIIESRNNLIYLSPDAEEILNEPDPSYIYVIGGLVDNNRYKKVIYSYCKSYGIRCARLPIKEHIELVGSPILTSNQVFEILIDFFASKDWNYSLSKNIPKRKIKTKNENFVI